MRNAKIEMRVLLIYYYHCILSLPPSSSFTYRFRHGYGEGFGGVEVCRAHALGDRVGVGPVYRDGPEPAVAARAVGQKPVKIETKRRRRRKR